MKRRYLPLLEVLEDKLPPGHLSIRSELANEIKMSVTTSNSASILRVVSNDSPRQNKSTAEVAEIMPRYVSMSRGKSHDTLTSHTGILPLLTSIDDIHYPINVTRSSASSHAVESMLDASQPHQAMSNVAGSPVVQPPAFDIQVPQFENSDLENLSQFVGQNQVGYSGSGGGGGGGEIGDPSGDWGHHLDNNDGYRMELNTVIFYGTGYTQVFSDLAQTAYSPPHWDDSSNHNDRDDRTENLPFGSNLPGRNMGEPISYARNTQMQALVNFNLIYDPPPLLQPIDNFPNDKTVYFHGFTRPELNLPVMYTNIITVGDPKSSGNKTYDMTFQQPLMNTVYHWDNMEIEWQYAYSAQVPGDESQEWHTFNESRNANYVTLDNSKAAKLYLTLAYYGTLNAHGQSTETATVQKMWEGSFKDAAGTMRAEDAKTLNYYGDWYTGNKTMTRLLADTVGIDGSGDGTCEAFAALWSEMIKAQGIETPVYTNYIHKSFNPDSGFLVNYWNIPETIQLNYPVSFVTYNWMDHSDRPSPLFKAIGQDEHSFTNGPVSEGLGLQGQNQYNPPSMFKMHVIISYLGILWDPSYGVTYMSIADFETRAIAGYFRQEQSTGGGFDIYFRKKDNDPTTADVYISDSEDG